MDVEVLRSSLEENPNDLRPLNQALKEILADPSSEESQAAFDELLDILFDEGAERETLRRTLDARLRTLKGENEDECVLLADVATRYWQGIGAADRAEPFFRKLQGKAGYEEVVREFYTGFYLGRGNWRRIEELLFESAGTKPGEPEAAAVYKTLAGHARDKGDGPREAQYLDKLHKADPSDDEVVERLIHLNKSTDRWHVVAQLLSARAEAAGDDLERLRETYAELVKVYTDQMGVEAKALGVYQEWRKRDPLSNLSTLLSSPTNLFPNPSTLFSNDRCPSPMASTLSFSASIITPI